MSDTDTASTESGPELTPGDGLKTAVILAIVGVVLLAGYFLYQRNADAPPAEPPAVDVAEEAAV